MDNEHKEVSLLVNQALLVAMIKQDKTNQIERFCNKTITEYEATDIDDLSDYKHGWYECSQEILILIKEKREEK